MITLKSPNDIDRLAEGGAILAEVLDILVENVKPGVTGKELDAIAYNEITKRDCVPSFLNYGPHGHMPYPASLCISIDDVVVHGIPTDDPLKEGDLVGLDLGLVYQGKYYLDSARTAAAGQADSEAEELMKVTRQSLQRGIEMARPGNRIGDIGAAIQDFVENYPAKYVEEGFGIVRELVGHGVGFAVHEDPAVPNYGRAGTGPILKPGMVIAIEPMITIGDPWVKSSSDGWSVVVRSGNLAAHFEHTIAITKNSNRILTKK